jgi:hypothetical protein
LLPDEQSVGKLSTVRALGLNKAVFAGASDRIVAARRASSRRMRHPARRLVLARLAARYRRPGRFTLSTLG